MLIDVDSNAVGVPEEAAQRAVETVMDRMSIDIFNRSVEIDGETCMCYEEMMSFYKDEASQAFYTHSASEEFDFSLVDMWVQERFSDELKELGWL